MIKCNRPAEWWTINGPADEGNNHDEEEDMSAWFLSNKVQRRDNALKDSELPLCTYSSTEDTNTIEEEIFRTPKRLRRSENLYQPIDNDDLTYPPRNKNGNVIELMTNKYPLPVPNLNARRGWNRMGLHINSCINPYLKFGYNDDYPCEDRPSLFYQIENKFSPFSVSLFSSYSSLFSSPSSSSSSSSSSPTHTGTVCDTLALSPSQRVEIVAEEDKRVDEARQMATIKFYKDNANSYEPKYCEGNADSYRYVFCETNIYEEASYIYIHIH